MNQCGVCRVKSEVNSPLWRGARRAGWLSFRLFRVFRGLSGFFGLSLCLCEELFTGKGGLK